MPKTLERLAPVHPGGILREEFLTPLSLSANQLATDLYVPATRIGEIINERRGITADTALRLARYFGTSAELWLNLQKNFELETATRTSGTDISNKIKPRRAA